MTLMEPKTPEDHMREFVEWVRWRRTQQADAPICEASLEYVVSEVEKILSAEKIVNKKRGPKPKKDLMWNCFYLVYFTDFRQKHMPIHKGNDKGAFVIVGNIIGLSASAVESQCRKAVSLYKTKEGKSDFMRWVSISKPGSSMRILINKCNPEYFWEDNPRIEATIDENTGEIRVALMQADVITTG